MRLHLLIASMFVLCFASLPASGQDNLIELLIIENVRVFTGSDRGLSKPFSFMIRDGKIATLEIDEEIAELTWQFDAEGAVLLGDLHEGEIANFLVLKGNPLKNISILADTRSHTTLLAQDGVLVVGKTRVGGPALASVEKPDSPDIPENEEEKQEKPSRTVSVEGQRKALWDTGFWSGDFRGVLGLTSQAFRQDDASIAQVGDLSEYEHAEVVAGRLTLSGYIGRDYRVNYYIDYGYNGFDEGFDLKPEGEWSLYNLEVTLPKTRLGTFTIGRQKAPESLSRVWTGQYITMAIRSVPISVLTASRDNGIRLNNSAFNQRMTWGVGAFNDWLRERGQSFSDTDTYYVGRVTGLPIYTDDGDHLMHLGLSTRFTGLESNSLRFRGRPGFFFGPDFIDTGELHGDGARWLIGEFSWKKKNFLVVAETVHTSIDSPSLGNPDFKGSYVWAEWTLTGESRSYNLTKATWNRPIPDSIFGTGGWGLWSIVASWSDTDLDDGLVTGGRLEEYVLGLSWYPSKSFRWGFEVGRARLDRYNIRGKTTFAQLYLHITNI